LVRDHPDLLALIDDLIIQLAWILAAVLPLPTRPELSKEATPSQLDVERVMARNLGPIDELQYQKARWWRNLNRIMSIVGILLIATIVCPTFNLGHLFVLTVTDYARHFSSEDD
jgi:hypothetical protein